MSQEIREILKDEAKVQLVAAKAFETVDTDGSGAISLDEMEDLMTGKYIFIKFLQDMAQKIGIPCPSNQEIQNAFKEINNNNEIGLEEFTQLVKDVMKLMASN